MRGGSEQLNSPSRSTRPCTSKMLASHRAPHIVVAGGGPAGLLTALLLGTRHSVRTTIIEPTVSTEQWSSKSYSIVLNERGMAALGAAGVLNDVKAAALEKAAVVIHSTEDGEVVMPRDPPHLALSRPALVDCLMQRVACCPHITLSRGVSVSKVGYDAEGDGSVRVSLDDGTTLCASHIVAADGKWSVVRAAFFEDWCSAFLDGEASSGECSIRSVPSWGVSLTNIPSVPKAWRADATHVFKPKTPDSPFYAIASPLPGGECSVSLVFFDAALDTMPWLQPQGPAGGNTNTAKTHAEGNSALADAGWEEPPNYGSDNAAGRMALSAGLAHLLATELPALAAQVDSGTLAAAAIGRRGSWVDLTVEYSAAGGRVALVGDAAHAMPPSLGEGCNCALESAVALFASLAPTADDGPPSIEELSVAFTEYGLKRPAEVRPVQLRSTAASQGVVPSKGAPTHKQGVASKQ